LHYVTSCYGLFGENTSYVVLWTLIKFKDLDRRG